MLTTLPSLDPRSPLPQCEICGLETPPGARPIGEARGGFLHIPAIKVRQAAQADDEPPTLVRSRFGWDVQEVSGSLGDLGTFLPHIIGAITIVRMDPTGILTTFGLFYALSGAFYGVPMAVQPMKAASAAMLIEPMNPGAWRRFLVRGAVRGLALRMGGSSPLLIRTFPLLTSISPMSATKRLGLPGFNVFLSLIPSMSALFVQFVSARCSCALGRFQPTRPGVVAPSCHSGSRTGTRKISQLSSPASSSPVSSASCSEACQCCASSALASRMCRRALSPSQRP